MHLTERISARIKSALQLKEQILESKALLGVLTEITEAVVSCYRKGGKVLWCGNGGSAADAQHLAAELSGRYYFDRAPLFSEALHVNTSYMTAVANDYSYEETYSRLVRAMGQEGDILIGMSTSGNSKNVVQALSKGNELKMTTVAFTGEGGGKMGEVSKHLIAIPSKDTPRIQECHMLLGHILCELVESALFSKE